MPRKAQPRIVRPSGIEMSANGNYYYWKCNVSGKETFAPEPRFKDVVKNYGSEEKLFKTYVLRPVQKYVDAGFDAETIKSIMEANEGELPKLDDSKVKNIKIAKLDVIKQPEPREVPVFPWSGNPDYFKSEPSVFSIEEETKNSCVYPNRNLDDQCFGCSIYDQCNSSAKFSKDAMKKPKVGVKVKHIDSFES